MVFYVSKRSHRYDNAVPKCTFLFHRRNKGNMGQGFQSFERQSIPFSSKFDLSLGINTTIFGHTAAAEEETYDRDPHCDVMNAVMTTG